MSEEKILRAFWAVVPASVLDDMQIPANAKLLYGVISQLMRKEGYCWASNAQLADVMHVTEDAVSKWLRKLVSAGHLISDVRPDKSKGGSVRYIYQSIAPPVLPGDGCSDKCPSTYPDKKTRVLGQKDGPHIIDKNKKKDKGTPAALAADLVDTAGVLYGKSVAEAMTRFLTMRNEIGKPIKSQQAASMLHTKLIRLSDKNPAVMVALLDRATEHQWLTLYARDGDLTPGASNLDASAPDDDHVEVRGRVI